MNASEDNPRLQRPYRTRTWVLFARDAPVAVVLRRGPKRVHRLIRWNLATDTFEPGQWMASGIDLSDLSPDGSKLLYRAAQYRRPRVRRSSRPFDPMVGKPLASLILIFSRSSGSGLSVRAWLHWKRASWNRPTCQ